MVRQRRLVAQLHAKPAAVGRCSRDGCGVAEGSTRGVGILTSHAPHAEAVTAVGRDGDLHDLLGQAQQLDRVVPRGQLGRVGLAQQ